MSTESSSKLNTSQTSNSINVIRKLIRDPMGAVGLLIVLSFLLIAIFADLIAPYDPNKIDILNKLQGPSLNHLVGTDQLGRDTFQLHSSHQLMQAEALHCRNSVAGPQPLSASLAWQAAALHDAFVCIPGEP